VIDSEAEAVVQYAVMVAGQWLETNRAYHARGKRPSACSVLTTWNDVEPIGTLHANPVTLFASGNDIPPQFRALFS